MQKIKGFRTIGIGLLMVIAPPALAYLAHVDWTQLVGPNMAVPIAGAIMIAMRMITDTAPGKNS